MKDFKSPEIRSMAANLRLIDKHVKEMSEDLGSQRAVRVGKDEKIIGAFRLKERKKDPRERFLITAQLFSICLGFGKSQTYPLPLI